MSWFAWLGLAVIVTVIAAVTGIQPKGARSIGHTRLMHMARLVLIALIILGVYLAFRRAAGG